MPYEIDEWSEEATARSCAPNLLGINLGCKKTRHSLVLLKPSIEGRRCASAPARSGKVWEDNGRGAEPIGQFDVITIIKIVLM